MTDHRDLTGHATTDRGDYGGDVGRADGGRGEALGTPWEARPGQVRIPRRRHGDEDDHPPRPGQPGDHAAARGRHPGQRPPAGFTGDGEAEDDERYPGAAGHPTPRRRTPPVVLLPPAMARRVTEARAAADLPPPAAAATEWYDEPVSSSGPRLQGTADAALESAPGWDASPAWDGSPAWGGSSGWDEGRGTDTPSPAGAGPATGAGSSTGAGRDAATGWDAGTGWETGTGRDGGMGRDGGAGRDVGGDARRDAGASVGPAWPWGPRDGEAGVGDAQARLDAGAYGRDHDARLPDVGPADPYVGPADPWSVESGSSGADAAGPPPTAPGPRSAPAAPSPARPGTGPGDLYDPGAWPPAQPPFVTRAGGGLSVEPPARADAPAGQSEPAAAPDWMHESTALLQTRRGGSPDIDGRHGAGGGTEGLAVRPPQPPPPPSVPPPSERAHSGRQPSAGSPSVGGTGWRPPVPTEGTPAGMDDTGVLRWTGPGPATGLDRRDPRRPDAQPAIGRDDDADHTRTLARVPGTGPRPDHRDPPSRPGADRWDDPRDRSPRADRGDRRDPDGRDGGRDRADRGGYDNRDGPDKRGGYADRDGYDDQAGRRRVAGRRDQDGRAPRADDPRERTSRGSRPDRVVVGPVEGADRPRRVAGERGTAGRPGATRSAGTRTAGIRTAGTRTGGTRTGATRSGGTRSGQTRTGSTGSGLGGSGAGSATGGRGGADRQPAGRSGTGSRASWADDRSWSDGPDRDRSAPRDRSALRETARPAPSAARLETDGGSGRSRAAAWITAHWGGASRVPHLPVIAVAVAVVLTLVAVTALLLVPSRHADPDAVATGTVAPQSPTPGATAAPGAAAAPASTVPRVARAATTGPFPSGVAAHTLAEANTWATFRGRPNDVVVMYTDRSSWNSLTSPWMGGSASTFAGFSGTWVITQPLFPDSGPEKGNLADCAAGDYDAHWRQFGRWLVNMGRGDSFVRLGWEFNGLWFAWAATDPQQWIQCFRHASSAIRAASPKARIDWNLNAHGSSTPVGAFDLYPGDQYVDVIGIDSYDQYPASPTYADFDAQCNGDAGLCQAITFARIHNKLFSVPEWGVVSQQNTKAGRAGAAGGDNPVYVEKMYETFTHNADILAYEAYFPDSEINNVRSSLVSPNLNPAAAAVYRRLWG
ncbi:glycosyl hydrolase [Frankia canadensis]|uniref:glycosyl hydrolase n=1 Tax=Frankia canadensis TaxID=1836972 RepID=UPI0024348C35|nr:glycosyl hydrolase [Frankia canadensis]